MAANTWKNRIVGSGEEAPDQLVANPRNYRLHPQFQQDGLQQVLDDVGWVRPVLVNKRTGFVIDGHLRVTLATENGEPTIPVEYVDLSEAEEAKVLAALDPLAALATPDPDMLKALSEEVDLEPFWQPEELANILAQADGASGNGESPGEDVEPQIDRAAELQDKYGTQLGQVWELGEHRLACGDCTESIAEFLRGKKISLVWTDPPYGVSYADKNAFLNAISRGNHIQKRIEADHGSEEETEKICEMALKNAVIHSVPGACCYVTVPAGPPHRRFIDAFNASGFTYKHQLIWVKNQFVLGRSDYHYRHEPILYGWIENGAHYWGSDHSQDTVFQVDKPHVSDLHPTMKPVELVEKMVRNSSKQDDIVYDPFLGSGTTLIACENLHRKCRAIEIDPGYVAVALERWATLTGREPNLMK